MDNLINILQIGFYEGLTWFPIVLAIGILYKYLKTIDVSIDGITVISSIAFTTAYNFSGSLVFAFLITTFTAIISYSLVSFLTTEFRINSILVGIILSLIFHSLSVIFIGESISLQYKNLIFLNSHTVALSIAVGLALLTEFFFRTNLGVRLKVAADNPEVNISANPRFLTLLIYLISGIILSIGVIQYTCKIGLSRSGGGFEFLITALSSFLFTDRIIDMLISSANRNKENYSYTKYIVYSIFQSPVFKALLGSILFQIIVLLIIYYTNNPAYWKLIFGIILLSTVAKPKLKSLLKSIDSNLTGRGIVLNNLTFHYDNGYENREVFNKLDFHFEPGINIIWGSNGVGKTSLLKLIGGKLEPQSGSILKNGRDITNNGRHKRKVFFINQMPYDSLSTNTTVFENVAAVSRKSSVFDFAIAKPLIGKITGRSSSLNIEFGKQNPFWVQYTGTLSGGQAQQLNLFLCSISDADLILADEPTSGMDNSNFDLFISFLEDIKAVEKTLILVTHDDRMKELEGNHLTLYRNKLIKKRQRHD